MLTNSVASPDIDINHILRQWRTRTLAIILIVVSLLVLPAVAATMLRLVALREWFWAALLLGMYLILLLVTFYRDVDFHVRGYTILFLGYAAGIFAFIVGGPTGDARLFLTVMPIFAFVLIGIRAGWVATGASLFIYLAFVLLGDAGVLEGALRDWLVRVGNPFAPGFWVMTWATLAALLVPTVTLLDRFYRLLLDALRAERRASNELAHAYDTTLSGWARALEVRDYETEGHSQRVADFTTQLARALGVSGSELVHLQRGALLHDIGKMGVPDQILLKPGPLTEEEWVVMRKHTEYAYQLLAPIEYLQSSLDIPHYHHEKWDGSGYPRRLKGEEIPLAARLFAVADVWDALCSDRPYRRAWNKEDVKRYIVSNAGRLFDPRVVQVFIQVAGDQAA